VQGKDNFAEPFAFTYRQNGTYQTFRGGLCTLIAGSIFWAYVLLRLYILCFNPQHTLYTQAFNGGLSNMGPVVESIEYQSFPVVMITNDGANVANQYDIFI
jgi:hypothetical protein